MTSVSWNSTQQQKKGTAGTFIKCSKAEHKATARNLGRDVVAVTLG